MTQPVPSSPVADDGEVASAVEDDVLTCPAPQLADEDVLSLLSTSWAIEPGSLSPLPSERDLNVLVDGRYVLKVSNPAERNAQVDLECQALAMAAKVAADLPLPRTVPTVTGTLTAQVLDAEGRECLARVITVVPGQPAEGRPLTTAIVEDIGALGARMSIALQGLFHPAAARRLDWDVRRAAEVLAELDPEVLGLTADELADLRSRCAQAADASLALPSGINHADVTLINVLLSDGHVSGLIDLGDMHHTANVCDLAVTVTSVARNTATGDGAGTWQLIRAAVTGYQRHRLLTPAEVDTLGDLILARLALSLAISSRRSGQHADNIAYISQYDVASRRVLRELSALAPAELRARLHRIAGTTYAPRIDASAPTPGLLDRRLTSMGGSLSPLFYREPLEIVRGEGPWLFDAGGARYLDAYNNVAVVGHAHPAVVQAVTRQLAAVNSHSRYLHSGVVELAERLLATLPAGMDTCLFTTSGTEANELAWRMATAYTGGTGAIIAEHAYHGSSRWFADLSSNEWPPGYTPAHVSTFAAPRTGTGGMDASTAQARIGAAAERLQQAGDQPALVLADLGFTSEGILDAPDDFIHGLVDGAHAAGALFLADEVQAGYGRIGPAMWRFAAHGVVPDLVTVGKPMGAGYPIGAVLTRREIADALARDYEYFSTFAATPAAAAAGLAVLDTLEAGDLPARALATGEHLRRRLNDVAADSAYLGEVRGSGLIAGVDTHLPDGSPARELARGILDALTRHRVLAGLAGPAGTVLKIRPPLVWEPAHADILADALRRALPDQA